MRPGMMDTLAPTRTDAARTFASRTGRPGQAFQQLAQAAVGQALSVPQPYPQRLTCSGSALSPCLEQRTPGLRAEVDDPVLAAFAQVDEHGSGALAHVAAAEGHQSRGAHPRVQQEQKQRPVAVVVAGVQQPLHVRRLERGLDGLGQLRHRELGRSRDQLFRGTEAQEGAHSPRRAVYRPGREIGSCRRTR